jgi:hypothetical protein
MSASTALILGAGFSHVAGLPLAKDLFDSEFLIPRGKPREDTRQSCGNGGLGNQSIPVRDPSSFCRSYTALPRVVRSLGHGRLSSSQRSWQHRFRTTEDPIRRAMAGESRDL